MSVAVSLRFETGQHRGASTWRSKLAHSLTSGFVQNDWQEITGDSDAWGQTQSHNTASESETVFEKMTVNNASGTPAATVLDPVKTSEGI